MLYARAKCRGGSWVGEDLVKHLVEVGRCARRIAEAVGLVELAHAAEKAGLLHDVGKAVFHRDGCIEGERLSFPGHEVVGAAVAKVAIRDTPDVVARAVLLHHQGLRGPDVARWRIDERVTDIRAVETALEVLMRLAETHGAETLKDLLAKALSKRRQLEVHLKNFYNLGRVVDKWHEARAVTAILMIADNVVASRAAEELGLADAKSKYVEDLERFTRGLNCR